MYTDEHAHAHATLDNDKINFIWSKNRYDHLHNKKKYVANITIL